MVSRNSKVDNFAISLFFVDYYKVLVFWLRFRDLSVCQSPIGVYAFIIIIIIIIIIISSSSSSSSSSILLLVSSLHRCKFLFFFPESEW